MRLPSENLHLTLRRATRFALQENYCNATFCGNIHHLIRRLNLPPAFCFRRKMWDALQWIELIRIHYRNEILTFCDLFQNLFRDIKNNEFSLKSEFRHESYVHIQAQNAMNYLCIAHLRHAQRILNVKKSEEIRALKSSRRENVQET